MSKRVLIITYYWPPTAGSGVAEDVEISAAVRVAAGYLHS